MSDQGTVAPVAGGEPANIATAPSPSSAPNPAPETSAVTRDDDVMPDFGFIGHAENAATKAGEEPAAQEPSESKEPEPAAADDKPWLKPPQFFNAAEKEVWSKLGPENIEKIKPILDGFMRRDGEREKGVEKFLSKLGPLRGVADNPPLVEAINVTLAHPNMAAAMDRMLEAFVKAPDKANFDPATVFATATPAPPGAETGTDTWQAKVMALGKMSKEDREAEIMANPDLIWQALNGLASMPSQAQKLVEDARREMAPVIEERKRAEAQTRANQELDAWLGELPQEYQALDDSGKEAVLSAMQKEIQANDENWTKRGHSPLARMELAYERVFQRVKGELAKMNKEAKLRSSRTDDLGGTGSAPPAAILGKDDISERLLRRVEADAD